MMNLTAGERRIWAMDIQWKWGGWGRKSDREQEWEWLGGVDYQRDQEQRREYVGVPESPQKAAEDMKAQ